LIFVDTSFWIALAARRDARHREATALWRTHGNEILLTSNLVRGETWTFIRSRYGHREAVQFLDYLPLSLRLQIVAIPEAVEDIALIWLRRRDERIYSFVDATSFMLMQSLGIREALAFDGDFSAAGFVELRA
jgi:uncharacterized protein